MAEPTSMTYSFTVDLNQDAKAVARQILDQLIVGTTFDDGQVEALAKIWQDCYGSMLPSVLQELASAGVADEGAVHTVDIQVRAACWDLVLQKFMELYNQGRAVRESLLEYLFTAGLVKVV